MTDRLLFELIGQDADVAASTLTALGYTVSLRPLASGHEEPCVDSRIVASVRFDDTLATLYVANIRRVV